MLGRGLRGPKVGGNKDCILYDVTDNFIGYGDQNEIYDYFDGYWNDVGTPERLQEINNQHNRK